MRSPCLAPMKSATTDLTTTSRSTSWPPSSMSSVPMLPEMSTASMRSRPEVGSSTGSPVHWGRAAAVTSASQMAHSNSMRRGNCRTGRSLFTSACSRNAPRLGTVRAAWVSTTERHNRRARNGSGASANAYGQIHSIMSAPRSASSGHTRGRRSG